jgi:hypothetical protein
VWDKAEEPAPPPGGDPLHPAQHTHLLGSVARTVGPLYNSIDYHISDQISRRDRRSRGMSGCVSFR